MMTILNVFALSVYKMIIIPSKASLCICLEDTKVRVHLYINPHPPPRRFRRGKCASSYPGLVNVAISTVEESVNQVSTNPIISRFLSSMISLMSSVLLHIDRALIRQKDNKFLLHACCLDVLLSYAYRAFCGLQR